MNYFHHKGLGNQLLQLCPEVVKHPVYIAPWESTLLVRLQFPSALFAQKSGLVRRDALSLPDQLPTFRRFMTPTFSSARQYKWGLLDADCTSPLKAWCHIPEDLNHQLVLFCNIWMPWGKLILMHTFFWREMLAASRHFGLRSMCQCAINNVTFINACTYWLTYHQ